MEHNRPQMSRRSFLRGLGITGAATTVPGLLAACGGGGGDPVAEGTSPAGGTSPAATAAPTTGAASPTGAATGETLRVGLMVPLSGTYGVLGEDMANAFQLYLDQNNGALGGRPVELITVETEANPEVGLGAAQRLIEEDQVAIVTGIVSSAVALGVRDLFHEAQLPLVVSNAGANAITREALSPFIFRSAFSNWQPNFALGEWAIDNVDAGDGFFCIAPDYAAGQEHVGGFREAYEQNGGGTVVGEVYPPFGTTTDYQPFLSQIQQSGAGAVMAFFAGGEAISFVQQYANFGLKDSLPLIGPGFLTDSVTLEAQGEAALGLRTVLHYAVTLDNQLNQDLIAAVGEATGGEPTTYTVQSYDAAKLIDLTLQQTGGEIESDTEAFTEAMANVGVIESARGDWTMDPVSHNPVQHQYLTEVQEVEGRLANAVQEDLGEYADPGPEGGGST